MALRLRGSQLGNLLAAVEAYERDDEMGVYATGLAVATLTTAYLDAMRWVFELRASLSAKPVG